MSLSFLQAFLDWISQNAIWSGLIIFAIACSESLALVGLLVPGAVLMFALGTLITTGHLEFWPAVSWAVAGAIVGDGISYWLGYYYQDRLARLWPLSHHPELLDKGRHFFNRHGGKSVLFGRFFGPLRPIVPAIAGMAGMPLGQFFIINIISGLIWGPLYLLPGMAFGLSLTLAGEVAGRLVLAILLLLASILFLIWLGKRIYQLILPRIDLLLFRITNWSHRHPLAGHIPEALIQPSHPEVRVLSFLALLLLITTSLYLALLQWSGQTSMLAQLDKLLRFNLELLRSPWLDGVMLSFVAWSDLKGILLISLLTSGWFIWQKKYFTLWHLLAVLAVPLLLAFGLPLLFTAPDSELPAAGLLMASTTYGFICVALAREIPQRYHLGIYLLLGILLFLNSFAALYLQLHTLPEIARGLNLGLIWLAVIGIAYRRHVRQAYVKTPALLGISLVYVICLIVVLPAISSLQRPEIIQTTNNLTQQAWLFSEWKTLPLVRNDVRYQRRHPLNLQWVGELEEIRKNLQQQGWQIPVSAQSLKLLQWLNPNPDDSALPLLPQVHDGHYDVLRLIKVTANGLQYLRLWHSGVRISREGHAHPLWLGSIGSLYRQQTMGLSLLRTSTEYGAIPVNFIDRLKNQDRQTAIAQKSIPLNGHSIPV
ncbi:MAG: VTT domain-containing protein, partial [Gammaproteobacteria bacterium]|nr:VTT domain-containing protein [Gammaproteobacteria bacterium]